MAETDDTDKNADEIYAAMGLLKLDEDARCACLCSMIKFFKTNQHDSHELTWDGRSRDPGVGYLQERLRPLGFVPMEETAALRAPLAHRAPSAPVPTAKQVITTFTDMLLGESMQPTIRCRQDEDSEIFMQAVFKEADAWDVLSEARNIAGACGAAVLVSGVVQDKPFIEVLTPDNCWVSDWEPNTRGWKPRRLVHQILISRTVADEEGKLVCKKFWQTRVWDATNILVYEDWPEGKEVPKEGIPIKSKTPHRWGVCPAIWYQNTRATDGPDGEADCEGAWPLMDQLDRVNSQTVKATIANADPTLVIKDAERRINRGGNIRKGSGSLIAVSDGGDAKYLEIQGNSIEAGLAVVKSLSEQILQTTRCVVATPEIIRSNESGEARQILWRSMESRANRLRCSLQNSIIELAELWRIIARVNHLDLPDQEVKTSDGESKWITPKLVKSSAKFTVEFPAYWNPTATQVESYARGLSIAAGAQPVFSTETASRTLAKFLGQDPDLEAQRVLYEREQARQDAIEDLEMEASINLPNGPKPDQEGEPTPENKPKPATKAKSVNKVSKTKITKPTAVSPKRAKQATTSRPMLKKSGTN